MARRAQGRRRRPGQRFTPRRWLPFVVLSALVAAGVVVAGNHQTPPDATARATADLAAALPAVATPRALTSAWFCGGGSAKGSGGPAELTLVLANDDARGAKAEITVYDDADHEATKQVDVPANGRARVAAASIRSGTWVAATVEVRGGRVAVEREVSGPRGFDATPCASTASARWFVPSGSTRRGSEFYLSLFNPFPDAASVDVSFATETGLRSPRSLKGFAVPGRSLRIVRVGALVTARAEVATRVTAKIGRVVVDRVQIHDGSGDPMEGTGRDASATAAPIGLVSTPGQPATAPRWFFPGTSLAPGTRSQVAIYNPGSEDASVDVVLAYEEPSRNPELEPIQITVPARRERILDLTDRQDLLPGVPFTLDVRALDGSGLVVERLSYVGKPAKRRGATVVTGSPVAAERWLVAQAGATRLRSTGVLVANPGSVPARIRVVALTRGTRRSVRSAWITVPAHDRRPLSLGDVPTAGTIEVRSSAPVVITVGISLADGLGLSTALAHPFPESIVALPPPD